MENRDPNTLGEAVAILAIVTAATMGTLARMVYADKHIPGKWESVIAIVSSAGSAVFVSPPIARYLASRIGVEPDLTFIAAVAWVFGVVGVNLVILLAGMDLSKWTDRFGQGPPQGR